MLFCVEQASFCSRHHPAFYRKRRVRSSLTVKSEAFLQFLPAIVRTVEHVQM
jgi:hypothetical protein